MSLAEPGARVTGDEELEQALRIILKTPLGSVPGDPGFGIELADIVDGPVNEVRPRIVRAVVQAVAASDPRIVVVGVQVVSTVGRIVAVVRWRAARAGAPVRETRVEVARGAT